MDVMRACRHCNFGRGYRSVALLNSYQHSPFSPMAIQTLFGSVPEEPSLLDRLKAGIEKTRAGLSERLEEAVSGKKTIDADLLDELEYALITADIGVNT